MPRRDQTIDERGSQESAEIVNAFESGKPFFYRRDPRSPWRAVTEMRFRQGMLQFRTIDSEEDRWSVEEPVVFSRMQQEAERSGGDVFVKKVQAQTEGIKRLDRKDTSPEGRRKLFETIYLPMATEQAISDLTGRDEYDGKYATVMNDFQEWAKDPKRVSERFPGWKGAHFAEMIKWMEEARETEKARVQKQFQESGVDPVEAMELIRKAKDAERKMRIAAERVRNLNGVMEGNPFGY